MDAIAPSAIGTIKNILLAHGLASAPERGRDTSWHIFIRSHLGALAGANFFTVEVLRGFGLVRYWVFFVIDIGTRRVHIAGITNRPSAAWMKQIARNLTDCIDGSSSKRGIDWIFLAEWCASTAILAGLFS